MDDYKLNEKTANEPYKRTAKYWTSHSIWLREREKLQLPDALTHIFSSRTQPPSNSNKRETWGRFSRLTFHIERDGVKLHGWQRHFLSYFNITARIYTIKGKLCSCKCLERREPLTHVRSQSILMFFAISLFNSHSLLHRIGKRAKEEEATKRANL